MTTYIPISKSTHARMGWRPATDYRHAAQRGQVPVLLHEVPLLLADMALAFMQHTPVPAGEGASTEALASSAAAAPGGFRLCGLMHLLPNDNLFVGPDGRWLGNHVPEALRAFPLALHVVAGKTDKVLCVEASHLVPSEAQPGVGAEVSQGTQAAPKPFFQADGQQSAELTAALKVLQEFELPSATQRAVDALASHGLLQPWALRTRLDERELPVQGLWCVDKAAMLAASGEVLAQLRDVGALALAFGQLWSMPQVNRLPMRAQYAAQVAARLRASAAAGGGQAGAPFQLPKGDTLKFS